MKKILICIMFTLVLCFTVHAQVICSGSDPKQIALTFDDGPSPVYTEKVLDILKSEGVPATFFLVGSKIENYPGLLWRIEGEGHEIGNHTYYHSKASWLSDGKIMKEINDTSQLIEKITGKKVVYFRPPHGDLSRAQRKMIEDAGYKVAYWSVNADDFYHTDYGMRTSASISKRVLSQVRGGDIILMHDDSEQTTDSLTKIIKALKKRGYNFVKLSQLQMPAIKIAQRKYSY